MSRLKGEFHIPYSKEVLREVDEEEFRDLYISFMTKLNERLDRVGKEISDNIGQVVVVDTLPTAESRLQGRIFQLRKLGASDDELYVCQESGSGYEMHQLGLGTGSGLEEWHAGSGAPDTGLGGVGDFYLDTTAYNVYEKTGASVWTLVCNIKGADGADGDDGAPGADGDDGAQGPAGAGVPVGGTVGQLLRKVSAVDYDTEWATHDHGVFSYVEFASNSVSPEAQVYRAQDTDDVILVDASDCDAYIVLPFAPDVDGRQVWVKKTDPGINKVYVLGHESGLP